MLILFLTVIKDRLKNEKTFTKRVKFSERRIF